MINFISNRPQALGEMCRVCRPHGVIAGYVWDFAAQRGPVSSLSRDIWDQVGAQPPPVPGTEHSRLEALTSLFAQAKLIDIDSMSETDREKLIDSVRAKLPAGPDGRITISARANAIKARAPA